MRLSEAYKILELAPNSSQEDTKKKYKELTKKYHPDINKQPGAEDRFKKINEAYNVIQKGEDEPQQQFPGGFDPFSGIASQFRRQVRVEQNITISTDLTFQESVLGCKKEISFNRKGKCNDCDGHGSKPVNNGCAKCGGRGQVTNRQGNMVFVQTCDKCMGNMKREDCKSCDNTGSLSTKASINVNIPGGVINGNILRIAGMGNYVGPNSFMGMFQGDNFTDLHLHINVSQESGLNLNGDIVVSRLNLSLLEALRGCKKTVKTVLGDKEIDIKPLSKNCDEIIIPRVGINGLGDQKVILDVLYPKDTSKLIGLLVSEEL